MDLAKRITSRRKELGLTRDDLAVALGVSAAAVHMWESGKTKTLKMAHVCAIADALNVSVRWLAEGKGLKEAAANMDAYSIALSRRDEAESEERKKGWERIAAVFAKAATVILLAIPPLMAQKADAAVLHKQNYGAYPFAQPAKVIRIVARAIRAAFRAAASFVRTRTSFCPGANLAA